VISISAPIWAFVSKSLWDKQFKVGPTTYLFVTGVTVCYVSFKYPQKHSVMLRTQRGIRGKSISDLPGEVPR
jgi:hypothetical protein